MKILLVSDSGEVLDSEDITREEFDNLTPIGAYTLIKDLMPGQEN